MESTHQYLFHTKHKSLTLVLRFWMKNTLVVFTEELQIIIGIVLSSLSYRHLVNLQKTKVNFTEVFFLPPMLAPKRYTGFSVK